MDKLEAVRVAALNLDRARDEEFHASEAWQRAKVRLTEADRNYAAALDALHEAPRKAGNDDDSQAPASLERTG